MFPPLPILAREQPNPHPRPPQGGLSVQGQQHAQDFLLPSRRLRAAERLLSPPLCAQDQSCAKRCLREPCGLKANKRRLPRDNPAQKVRTAIRSAIQRLRLHRLRDKSRRGLSRDTTSSSKFRKRGDRRRSVRN